MNRHRHLLQRIGIQTVISLPEATSYLTWTAVIQEALAKQLAHRGQWKEAEDLLNSSIDTLSHLRREDPDDAYVQKLSCAVARLSRKCWEEEE